MTLAQKLISQGINNFVAKTNAKENLDEAFVDGGKGVILPELTEEEVKNEHRNKFALKDLEYPNLQLIICKKGKVAGNNDKKGVMPEDKMVFIDGVDGCEPCVTLRLNNLKKGEYFVLYRPDFKPFHTVKRINVVFYSEFYGKKSASELKSMQLKSNASRNHVG
jgi:hypothetical protein